MVQRWDLAAWGNALALLKETPRYRELASIVAAAAWMAHGEKFVQYCFPTVMEEDRDELAELFHRELTELVEERTFTVRFFNDKGRYKSLEIPHPNMIAHWNYCDPDSSGLATGTRCSPAGNNG